MLGAFGAEGLIAGGEKNDGSFNADLIEDALSKYPLRILNPT